MMAGHAEQPEPDQDITEEEAFQRRWIRARFELHDWKAIETDYADQKFAGQRASHDDEMREDGINIHGFWYNQIFQYVRRAQILGLDTPQGRQALAKCYMTIGGAVESVIRVFGDLPKPGVPSGTIEEWDIP